MADRIVIALDRRKFDTWTQRGNIVWMGHQLWARGLRGQIDQRVTYTATFDLRLDGRRQHFELRWPTENALFDLVVITLWDRP